MRIHVKADGRRINLILPTAILLNRITAHLVAGRIRIGEGEAPLFSGRQLTRLFAAARRFKKKHPDFVFVEVQTHDSEEIILKL